MALFYASLPLFWSDLVDSLSGCENDLTLVSSPSSTWPDPLIGNLVVSNAILSLTVFAPDGDIDVEMPAPDDSMTGYRNVNQQPGWRRTVNYSFDSDGPGGSPPPMVVTLRQCRDLFFTTLWSSLRSDPIAADQVVYIPYQVLEPEWNEFVLYLYLLRRWVSPGDTFPVTYSAGPTNTTKTLDSTLDVTSDLTGVCVCFARIDSVVYQTTPLSPNDQVGLRSLIQAAGVADLFVAGQDIVSLNLLADALASGRGLHGSVFNHRSQSLLSLAGPVIILPPPTGTSDDMMHRMADAVRNAFAGPIILRTKRPKASFAANAGIVLKG